MCRLLKELLKNEVKELVMEVQDIKYDLKGSCGITALWSPSHHYLILRLGISVRLVFGIPSILLLVFLNENNQNRPGRMHPKM